MLFHTSQFVLFFLCVRLAYAALPWKGQNWLLLGASYFFYGSWDWRFLGLLWLTTLVDWALGLALHGARGRRRDLLVSASVVLNLGVLGFFKYCDFFTASANALAARLGLALDWPTLSLVLPVGISFYTFQSLSYTLDVYRGRIEPCRSLPTFALYVAYFPQLVAGPIERARNLLPQLAGPRQVAVSHWMEGSVLILLGLVRKVCIADVVAPLVDRVFADPAAQSSGALALAVLLFGVQIYADFSGYSDMARGVSKLLGIELMVNFRAPYFSTSLREFWTRWHISLSTWLRDYLYIPLGGNRSGERATHRNLLLTMLLGGLWHGAAWNFVIWGGLHGGALVVERQARAAGRRWGSAVLGWACTMLVVFSAWVFFRAHSLESALQVFAGVLAGRGGLDPWRLLTPALAVGLLMTIDVPQHRSGDQAVFLRWHWAFQGAFYALLVLALVLLRAPQRIPFLYFQF